MAALLSFIPPRILFGAVALACAALALTGTYLLGKHNGRSEAALAAMEATVEAYQTRGDIDDDVSRLDAIRLCRELAELSGMPNGECEQLRGMDEATGGE